LERHTLRSVVSVTMFFDVTVKDGWWMNVGSWSCY